jgi:Mn-dependent DtxR family transcriptional regulator
MNTEEMKGQILEVLNGAQKPMSSGSIALRLGIDWRQNPTAYERVGKTLAKLKKAGLVELERGKGWKLSNVFTATPKSSAQLDYEITEALRRRP